LGGQPLLVETVVQYPTAHTGAILVDINAAC
jgi:hypothetical protein